MALKEILSSRTTVLLGDGRVNSGGTVTVLEPNSSVPLTTFADAEQSTTNPSPVPLNAAGKASIWVLQDCDIDIRNAAGDIIVSEQGINPDEAGTTNLVINGGFEIDSEPNGIPDGWTLTNEAGSANLIDTSQSTEGAQSYQFASTGTGGGDLESEEFFAVNGVDDVTVGFDIKSNVADVRNIVRVDWYDVSQVFISSSTPYDEDTSNPTVFTAQTFDVTPPATARFAKLVLIGCDPSDATVGNTNYDRVSAQISANTLTGDQSFSRLRLTATDSVTLASTLHALQNGPDASFNLAMSIAGIQARNNGAASPLNLNALGGAVTSMLSIQLSAVLPTLASTTHALTLAPASGRNLALGAGGTSARIQARNNGVASSLELNVLNGTIFLGNIAAQGMTIDATEVSVFHGGDEIWRSETPANGGLLINNQATGAGLERGLTTADLLPVEQGAHAEVQDNRNNDAVLSDDTEIAGIVLEENTYYQIEGYFEFRSGNATPGVRFALQLSQVAQDEGWSYHAADAAGANVQDQLLPSATVLQTLAGNIINAFSLKGYIQTNATGTTTVDFQWAQNVSNATATSRLVGAYLRFTPVL